MFVADSMGLSSFKFSWWAPKDARFEIECVVPSRSSKVVDFGTNRKPVCDFLLVVSSNHGPILPRFRNIAGFLRTATPHLFHPNFRDVLLGLDCRCCGSEERRPDPKLIIRVITFELTSITPRIPQRHGQTDGRLTIAIPR